MSEDARDATVQIASQPVRDGGVGVVVNAELAVVQIGQQPAQRRIQGINTAQPPRRDFVPRPEKAAQLLNQLLRRSAPTEAAADTFVCVGGAGAGKTWLARYICYRAEVASAFPHAILWIKLGRSPNRLQRFMEVMQSLTHERRAFESEHEAETYFRTCIADHAVLIVLDDVWDVADAQPFLQAGPRGAHLVTTRRQDVASELGSSPISIDAMTPGEATSLLAVDPSAGKHGRALQTFAKRMGFWPLALGLAAGQLRQLVQYEKYPFGDALAKLRADLDARGLSRLDPSTPAGIDACLSVSLSFLGEELALRFIELGIFAEGVEVPFSAVSRLWSGSAGVDSRAAEDMRRCMRRMSLFSDYDGVKLGLRLHDVVRVYLREKLGDRASEVHAQFLDAGLEKMNGWSTLAREEVYLWSELGYHLVEANRRETLRECLFDLRWLSAKLNILGTTSLLIDFERLRARADPALNRLEDTLRLSGHILDRNRTELAHQLLGRLGSGEEAPEIRRLLHDAQESLSQSALIPVTPSLTPPGRELALSLQADAAVLAVALDEAQGRATGVFRDGDVRVWSLERRELVHRFSLGDRRLLAADLDVPRSLAVSGHSDGTAKIWNTESGELIHTLDGHSGPVKAVALSRDGRFAVSADRNVRLWSVADGSLVRALSGYSTRFSTAAVAANGVHAISYDGQFHLWNLSASAHVRAFTPEEVGPLLGLALSDTGTRAIAVSRDGMLHYWDTERGVLLSRVPGASVSAVALATIGGSDLCVLGRSDGTLDYLDPRTGQSLWSVRAHDAAVTAVAVSSDSRWAATGSIHGEAKVWRLAQGSEPATFRGPRSAISALGFVPSRQQAFAALADGTLVRWDTASSKVIDSCEPRLRGQVEEPHEGIVSSFAPDAALALTAATDGVLRVWSLDTARVLHRFRIRTGNARAVALDRSGSLALCGLNIGAVDVWDLIAGKHVRRVAVHTGRVSCLALDDRGAIAASGSRDGTVRLWSPKSGEVLQTFSVQGALSIAIESKNELVMSGTQEGDVLVWSLAGDLVHRLTGNGGAVGALEVGRSGTLLATGSHDGVVRLWDIGRGDLVRSFVMSDRAIKSVCLDDERGLVGAADERGGLALWAIDSGAPVGTWASRSRGQATIAMSFGARGLLLLAGEKGKLELFDRESADLMISLDGSLDPIRALVPGAEDDAILFDGTFQRLDFATARAATIIDLASHRRKVNALAMSWDGRVIATGSDDRTIRIWSVETGKIQRTIALGSEVWAVAFDRSGARLLAGLANGTLGLWETSSGSVVKMSDEGRRGVRSVAISPDSAMALSGAEDRAIKLWDLTTFECVSSFSEHFKPVGAIAFGASGQRAISGGEDAVVHVWELRASSAQRESEPLKVSDGMLVLALADGDLALVGSQRTTLEVWDVNSRRRLRSFEGQQVGVSAAALSQNGKLALAASDNLTCTLWDLESGRSLARFPTRSSKKYARGDRIHALALSRDMGLAVAGSDDGRLSIWNLSTCKLMQRVAAHRTPVSCVAFNRDGSRVLSASTDAKICEWRWVDDELRELPSHGVRVTSISFGCNDDVYYTGAKDGTLRTWSYSSSEASETYTAGPGLRAMFVSDSGRLTLADSQNRIHALSCRPR